MLPLRRQPLCAACLLTTVVMCRSAEVAGVAPTRQAASYPILKGGKVGYIDRAGRIVVAPIWDRLDALGNESLISTPARRQYQPGRFVPQLCWSHESSLSPWAMFSEGLAVVRRGNKLGYINTAGDIVMQPQFTLASAFSQGVAWVAIGGAARHADLTFFLIDSRGTRLSAGLQGVDYRSPDGRASVAVAGRWGLLDPRGKFLVEPLSMTPLRFVDGLATYTVPLGQGIVHEGGEVLRDVVDELVGEFKHGLASVKRKGKVGVIDVRGNLVVEPEYDSIDLPFTDGRAAASEGGKWGYVNLDGELAISATFDYAGTFSDGAAPAGISGKYGVIDREGEWMVEPRFSEPPTLTDGIAIVAVDEEAGPKYGLLSMSGAWIVEPTYKSIDRFAEGRAIFILASAEGDRQGYLNHAGRVVIEPRFSFCAPFSDGLAYVREPGRGTGNDAIIDRSGMYLIGPRFESIGPLVHGCRIVCDNNGKYGYVDAAGVSVIEPTFSFACPFDFCGVALVNIGGRWGFDDFDYQGRWGYVDRVGNWIWEPSE